MHTTVLLLDEGTALALVGVVAIIAVCLLALALVGIVFVVLHRRDPVPAAAPPTPSPASVPNPFAVLPRGGSPRKRPAVAAKDVEIDVPTRHADAIIQALQASGWFVRETGEVVATDDDEEGLTTISVDVPGSVPRPSSGEEVH